MFPSDLRSCSAVVLAAAESPAHTVLWCHISWGPSCCNCFPGFSLDDLDAGLHCWGLLLTVPRLRIFFFWYFFLWLFYGFWKTMEGGCHPNRSQQVFMLPQWTWAWITWSGGSLGYCSNFVLHLTLSSSHLKDRGIMLISKTMKHPPEWLGVVLHGRLICFLPFLFNLFISAKAQERWAI